MHCSHLACREKVTHIVPPDDYNATCHSGQSKLEKQTPSGSKSTCKAMSQCNQLHVNIRHSICKEAKLACTHTHTHTQLHRPCPLPVTAPEQEQQNLHRGLTQPWYSQSHHHHHHQSRRLAACRAMMALLVAWLLHHMHAVTVCMGHSWRLRMRCLQQIQDLHCSQ